MTAADRAAFEAVNVGDIFDSNWGYEQTNVDFYEVVGKTKARIRVRKIGKRMVEGDGTTRKMMVPIPGNYVGEVKTRQVKAGYRGQPGFSPNEVAWASAWDGTPQFETGYMVGH